MEKRNVASLVQLLVGKFHITILLFYSIYTLIFFLTHGKEMKRIKMKGNTHKCKFNELISACSY